MANPIDIGTITDQVTVIPTAWGQGVNDWVNGAYSVLGSTYTATAFRSQLSLDETVRNCFINGGMDIDQRNEGATQTFTNGAALAYSVDQWHVTTAGSDVTGARIIGSGNTPYRYQITGAIGNTSVNFGQRMTSANTRHLAGQQITIAVDMANSLLTSVSYTIYKANSTDSFAAKTSIHTGTLSSSISGTISRPSVTLTLDATATTGIEIIFSVANQTSGTWTIGNASLKKGTFTAFDYLNESVILRNCQQFYEKSYEQGASPGTVTYNGCSTHRAALTGMTSIGFNDTYKVEKFTTPSTTFYAPTASTANRVRNNTTGSLYAVNSISSLQPENKTRTPMPVISVAATAGDILLAHWVSEAVIP
jgi:hypothetical protein